MDIFAQVKEIIVKELGIEPEKVTLEASFINDLGADSLDIVDMLMVFEEEFDLEIPEDDAENITTVKEAVDYIEESI